MQNLRRFLRYNVQYFAVIEPQGASPPTSTSPVRGTVSRAELRRVLAATYPPGLVARYLHRPLQRRPVASLGHRRRHLPRPATGEVLPSWDQSLDAIGEQDELLQVVRFGTRFDAQGVLAASKDATRWIRYLTKSLTKHVADCHQRMTPEH